MKYSKMIKYIILFCIISSSASAMRGFGDYEQLVLAQRPPYTAFLEHHHMLGNEGRLNAEASEYFRQNEIIFNTHNWIIHGLFSLKSGLRLFQSYYHTPTNYRSELSDTNFDKLRRKWPSFYFTQSQENFWQSHYNVDGYAIRSNSIEFLQEAERLLDNHNVGKILGKAGIVPHKYYELKRIKSAISKVLKVHPYIICAPIEDSSLQEQYLLEVDICYDNNHVLTNCDYDVGDLCHNDKSVIYRG